MSTDKSSMENDYIDTVFQSADLKATLQRERESYASLKHSMEKNLETLGKQVESQKITLRSRDERIGKLEESLAQLIGVLEKITMEDDQDNTRTYAFSSTHTDCRDVVDLPLGHAKKLLDPLR